MSSSSLIYIPCGSLNVEDLQSLIRLAVSTDVERVDKHGGRQVALKYLLNMHSIGFDLSSLIKADQWKVFQEEFDRLKQIDLYRQEFHPSDDQRSAPYWELTSDSSHIHSIAKKSRSFHQRTEPFPSEQLKVYFNRSQLENIPYSKATFKSAGFLDEDVRENILRFPREQRQNRGQIHTRQGRIEQAIFEIPANKQVIILDFADERMLGGERNLFSENDLRKAVFRSFPSWGIHSRRNDLLSFGSLSCFARFEISEIRWRISHSGVWVFVSEGYPILSTSFLQRTSASRSHCCGLL